MFLGSLSEKEGRNLNETRLSDSMNKKKTN